MTRSNEEQPIAESHEAEPDEDEKAASEESAVDVAEPQQSAAEKQESDNADQLLQSDSSIPPNPEAADERTAIYTGAMAFWTRILVSVTAASVLIAAYQTCACWFATANRNNKNEYHQIRTYPTDLSSNT